MEGAREGGEVEEGLEEGGERRLLVFGA